MKKTAESYHKIQQRLGYISVKKSQAQYTN